MKETLLTLIISLPLASFWCFGFRTVFEKLILKEIFGEELDEHWDSLSKFSKTLLKPLFACPPCMASLHGTAFFFILLAHQIGFGWWPVFCVTLCGLNYVVTQIIYSTEGE